MGENAQGGVLSKMLKGEFITGGRMRYLVFRGEEMPGGRRSQGEEVCKPIYMPILYQIFEMYQIIQQSTVQWCYRLEYSISQILFSKLKAISQ